MRCPEIYFTFISFCLLPICVQSFVLPFMGFFLFFPFIILTFMAFAVSIMWLFVIIFKFLMNEDYLKNCGHLKTKTKSLNIGYHVDPLYFRNELVMCRLWISFSLPFSFHLSVFNLVRHWCIQLRAEGELVGENQRRHLRNEPGTIHPYPIYHCESVLRIQSTDLSSQSTPRHGSQTLEVVVQMR